MGGLLARNGYLEKIATVFVQVLSLAKAFIKHLKLSIADDKNDKDSESELEMQGDEDKKLDVK
jgi:hypothetical protein